MTIRQAGSSTREAQRRRTRQAIVEATRHLLDTRTPGGPDPTVDEVAAAAEVSRRTIYLHFPTLDQLLLDATLGALSEAHVAAAIEPARADGAGPRVAALAAALHDLTLRTLPLGRRLVRLTVDRPADAEGPVRGVRRVAWIEDAVEPLGSRLTAEQHDRLVSALAVALGFEASIVLADVRGLPADREAEVLGWVARVLVEAMEREAADP